MSLIRELLKTYYDLDESSKFDIDEAINKLKEDGSLSAEEFAAIMMLKEHNSREDVANMLGISPRTLMRRINTACSKLANVLGEDYQDSKIIRQVEERLGRKLTDDEHKFCLLVIQRGYSLSDVNIFNFKTVGKVSDGESNGDKEEG